MKLTDVNIDICRLQTFFNPLGTPVHGDEMVKHPRYQAQDVGRMEEIPRAFERHCPDTYRLERIEPKRDPQTVGPIPRPTFRVLDEEGNLVAHFHPYGHSECHNEVFRTTYKKMEEDIERAGIRAMKAFEKEWDSQ